MKRLLIQFALIFILLLTLVGLFSSKESQLVCHGTLDRSNESIGVDLNMRLTEYRWWVNLWNDSDGMLRVEIPGNNAETFLYLKRVEDQIQIWTVRDATTSGSYLLPSAKLSIAIKSGDFRGTCAPQMALASLQKILSIN